MERAIIYYAKTGLEATDHFVPKLLEKYCQDNGYEIVAMLSEPASTEGVSFPMKYAIIGLNMEEDVNTIITLSKDMIGATDETVIDTLGKLSEYDIYGTGLSGYDDHPFSKAMGESKPVRRPLCRRKQSCMEST